MTKWEQLGQALHDPFFVIWMSVCTVLTALLNSERWGSLTLFCLLAVFIVRFFTLS